MSVHSMYSCSIQLSPKGGRKVAAGSLELITNINQVVTFVHATIKNGMITRIKPSLHRFLFYFFFHCFETSSHFYKNKTDLSPLTISY